MRLLHYHIYNDGNAGMANILSSIENGLIIGRLTNRKVIFYANRRTLPGSENVGFLDLFDIQASFEFVHGDMPETVQNGPALPTAVMLSVLCYGEKPDAEFCNGRTSIIDLKDYDHFDQIRTMDAGTLGWFSYLFYLNIRQRRSITEFVSKAIRPRSRYLDAAIGVVDTLKKSAKSYCSIHVRRGDYIQPYTRNGLVTAEEMLPVIEKTCPKDSMLVIHTDEQDEHYFDAIKQKYRNHWLIDKQLVDNFPDSVERGLVSLLVASHSDNFIGTYYSTFTGLIQRYRKYNGYLERFLYLYSQQPMPVVNQLEGGEVQTIYNAVEHLPNGKQKEGSFGKYTWNRLGLPANFTPNLFWAREWPCSYPNQFALKQGIAAVPDFLEETEIDYLLNKAKEKINEEPLHTRENRHRSTLDQRFDPVVSDIVVRACRYFGYDYDHVEPGMQLFTQYTGGQTYTHVDSVHESEQGRRMASVLFYLNNDYQGSYIDFPYSGIRVKPKRGMMITYPLINEFDEQDIRFTHSASIITEGTKVMCYFSVKETSL
nr:hypothetical protein [uncultured Arsenicibacter sp.]